MDEDDAEVAMSFDAFTRDLTESATIDTELNDPGTESARTAILEFSQDPSFARPLMEHVQRNLERQMPSKFQPAFADVVQKMSSGIPSVHEDLLLPNL